MIFEFIVAAMLFFSIIFYVISFMSGSVSAASVDLQSGVLESRTVRISEMLVRTKGVWNQGIPVSPGLVSWRGWPVLSSEKIGWLESYCRSSSGYDALRQNTGLLEGAFGRTYELKITVANKTDVLADCGKVREELKKASIRRFGVSETGDILTVDVTVS